MTLLNNTHAFTTRSRQAGRQSCRPTTNTNTATAPSIAKTIQTNLMYQHQQQHRPCNRSSSSSRQHHHQYQHIGVFHTLFQSFANFAWVNIDNFPSIVNCSRSFRFAFLICLVCLFAWFIPWFICLYARWFVRPIVRLFDGIELYLLAYFIRLIFSVFVIIDFFWICACKFSLLDE